MAIALNSENDMFSRNGKIERVYDGGQVLQYVRCRLLHYYGEWFLDTLKGVPYFEKIFIRPSDLHIAESILKQKIIQTTGIDSLISFSMIFNSDIRQLNVSFEATTTSGDAINTTINLNPL